ncbi:YjcZ family sporulation protein [Paenibacillus sp. DYY-L-2]
MSGVVGSNVGYGGGGYGGGIWTSTGAILVLFILLVIVSRAFLY